MKGWFNASNQFRGLQKFSSHDPGSSAVEEPLSRPSLPFCGTLTWVAHKKFVPLVVNNCTAFQRPIVMQKGRKCC